MNDTYQSVLIILAFILLMVLLFKNFGKDKTDTVIALLCAIINLVAAIIGIADISKGNNIIVGNDNNGSIVTDIKGDVIINQNNNTVDREELLLSEAKIAYENKEYKKAVSILNLEELEKNPYARLNLGYMYAHGYGVEQNTDEAAKEYRKVNLAQARRNELVLLIITNVKGKNNDAIETSISNLLKAGDIETKEYIEACTGEVIKDDDYIVNIEKLYKYEYIDTKSYKDPPKSTAFEMYRFKGANYDENDSRSSLPSYYYERYRMKHIEIIDEFVIG